MKRQLKPEGAAVTEGGLHAVTAVMLGYDVTNDRKSKSRALGGALMRTVDLIVTVPHKSKLILGNACRFPEFSFGKISK